jgi:hypothetical protein
MKSFLPETAFSAKIPLAERASQDIAPRGNVQGEERSAIPKFV